MKFAYDSVSQLGPKVGSMNSGNNQSCDEGAVNIVLVLNLV